MNLSAKDIKALSTLQVFQLYRTMHGVTTGYLREEIATVASELVYDREACHEVGAKYDRINIEDFYRLELLAFCYMPLRDAL